MQDYLELGRKDPYLEKGRWRFGYPAIKEMDPVTYDPPIKNSRMAFQVGKDTAYDTTLIFAYRYMGMPIEEWKYKVLYRQNPMVKHIYDNWDLSDEHPGLKFTTGFREQYATLDRQGNMVPYAFLLKRLIPWGRYFDAPAGEQCFTKSFCCAKNMAITLVPIWAFDCMGCRMPEGWKNIIAHYFRWCALPVPAAFMWGAITCLVSSYRGGPDDLINLFWGTVASSSVYGIARGPWSFFTAFVVTLPASWYWFAMRDYMEGPMGRDPRHDVNFNDALSHKWSTVPSFTKDFVRNY